MGYPYQRPEAAVILPHEQVVVTGTYHTAMIYVLTFPQQNTYGTADHSESYVS